MEQTDFTQLLRAIGSSRAKPASGAKAADGGADDSGRRASAELFKRAQAELRAIAAGKLRRERGDHTLQATALVNEAYLRLFGGDPHDFNDRRHFFAAAALSMQRVLLEHARNRNRKKRGGGRERVPLSVVDLASDGDADDALAVKEALEKLTTQDPALAELVRLRFYTGLSEVESADVLGVSERTVRRDWQLAKAWLTRELRGSADTDAPTPDEVAPPPGGGASTSD